MAVKTRGEVRGTSGRWWAAAALLVSALAIGLDITVLFTALPTLATKLSASTSELQWISASYTLALGGLLLPAGVLGDRYGRRRLLLIGLVIFGVASVLASQMTTATGLILMRALMGVGSAIVLPLSVSILPSMFSEAERPRAVALLSAGALVGLPAGPLVAGYLLTHASWGTIFLINAPVVAAGLIGVWFLVPESKDPEARAFDWVGAIMAVAGVTALVYGIIEQPANGWGAARVLFGLGAGVIVLAAFVIWDLRQASPFVDPRLFRSRMFAWATMAFVVVGFAMTGALFVLTPYIQVVLGYDAQATGLRLIPMIGAMIVGAVLADRLARRAGKRLTIAGGLTVVAAGLLLLSRATGSSGYELIAEGMVVTGLGLGLAMPTALDTVLGSLPPGQTGTGSALTRALQQVAGSFGVAILGGILNSVYRSDVEGVVAGLPPAAVEAIRSSVAGAAAVAAHLPGGRASLVLHTAGDAYAHGFSQVMIVCAVIMLIVAVGVALFLPSGVPSTSAKRREEE